MRIDIVTASSLKYLISMNSALPSMIGDSQYCIRN